MNNDIIVLNFKEHVSKESLSNSLNRELINTRQTNLNDLFIGVVLNKIEEKNIFEIYFYLKTKKTIACPLKYQLIKNENEAIEIYNKRNKILDCIKIDNLKKLVE